MANNYQVIKLASKVFRNRFVFAIVLVFSLLLVLISILFLFNRSRIVLGVNLSKENIGGTKISQLSQSLDDYFTQWGKIKVLVRGKRRSFISDLNSLGVEFFKKETMKELSDVGHQGSFIYRLAIQVKTFLTGWEIKPVMKINLPVFKKVIKEGLPGLEVPVREATVKYSSIKNNFEVVSSQEGQRIQVELLPERIQKTISRGSNQKFYYLDLQIQKVEPRIKTEDVISLANLANQIIARPVILIAGNNRKFKVDRDLIAQWIDFQLENNQLKLVFNREEIENYLTNLSQKINQKPVNAQVDFSNGKVQTFSLAHWGRELDILRSAEMIEEGLNHRQKKVKLIINLIKPLIETNSDIEKLGIGNLLVVGQSDFSGSPQNRVHNIIVGSGRISGTLIPPGQEFSFNQSIGEVSKENGYLPELVIKNHQVIPELGGGLCQISTTIFRAAVRAGLPITERQPHAFPVIYYNPQGFDATIYSTGPDLKFINDTPNYILIQGKIKGNHLYVYIYGTGDGREVKVIGPKVIKNTLKIKNQEGRLINNPQGILKTVLTQEIWRNGKIVHRVNFWSTYHSPLLFGE